MTKKKVQFLGDPVGKQIISHYETLVAKYNKEWDSDIVFVLCHGDYARMPREMDFDKFYIFIQLLPKEFQGVKRAKITHFTIDGKKLVFPVKADTTKSCPQGDSLKFSKDCEGSKIIVDEEGSPIAVVYDSALYILNDFIHCRSKVELDISVKIFNYVIEQAVGKTDLLKHLKAGIEEKSKRSLMHALKSQFVVRLDKEKVQLQAARDTVDQYVKGIVDCERKVLAGEKILLAIQNNLKDIPRALDKTWESIYRLAPGKLYESISFTKTGLKAVSQPIVITHDKVSYDMGKYEVKLGFNGDTSIHAIENRVTGSHDHPHISSGKPCWGNFSGEIPKRIGASEYDVALILIHTFLSHYDQQSPYRQLSEWPKVKVKKGK